MYKPNLFHILVIVTAIGLSLFAALSYPTISAKWQAESVNHWCGLFVKDASGSPVPNLAVSLSGYGSGPYTYSTDQTGYTGKIWSTGITNGCVGGLDNIEIPATVMWHNTQYAIYLQHDANVTLTLGS